MLLHLNIIGFLLIALSLFHAGFPKHFNWKKEFADISLINRQVMYIHTFFIALTIFLMGLLCVSSSDILMSTVLGKRLALGLGIFWGARLIIQFVGFSSKLWRGKKFETTMHILFAFIWTYITTIFLCVYFY